MCRRVLIFTLSYLQFSFLASYVRTVFGVPRKFFEHIGGPWSNNIRKHRCSHWCCGDTLEVREGAEAMEIKISIT